MVFFDYPPAIRKVIYTTNAIESLNYSLRKVFKKKGVFQNDGSINKMLYLAIRNIAFLASCPTDWYRQNHQENHCNVQPVRIFFAVY